jgi:hypothetical protein
MMQARAETVGLNTGSRLVGFSKTYQDNEFLEILVGLGAVLTSTVRGQAWRRAGGKVIKLPTDIGFSENPISQPMGGSLWSASR